MTEDEKPPSLEEIVAQFKQNRKIFDVMRPSIEEIEEIRLQFVNDFSKEKLSKLSLEEYADGYIDPNTGDKKQNSFSYRVAVKMPIFGSIENPSGLYTHEVFIRKNTQNPDYRKSRYKTIDEAFTTTKKLLVNLLEAGENFDIQSIENNSLHAFLKSKILCIYFPEKFLDIHSKPACSELVNKLKILSESEIKNKSMFELQQELLLFKNNTLYLRDLNNVDYGYLLWLYYEHGIPSIKKVQKQMFVYLDDLLQHSVPITHIQILKKFYKTRGKYIPSSEIYGKWLKKDKWEKVPAEPDNLIDEPHFMHNLITGVYTPKDDNFAQSILLNPKSKWDLEIDKDYPTLKINYDFGDYDKYKNQIEKLKNCFEKDVPFGIFFSISKGKIKSLGLGQIISHNNTTFTIESYGISDTESSKLKDETIEEFEETLTDPDFARLDEIDYENLFNQVNFDEQQTKLKRLKEPEPRRARISQIIDYCNTGEWVIPLFQRYFNWRKEDIRDFLKSIFLDYYVGSLLLWDVRKETSIEVMPVQGISMQQELKKNAIVLDGQQRITSLYYAIMAPDFPLRGSGSKQSYFYIDFTEFLKEGDSENLIRVFNEKLDKSDCFRKMLFPFYELQNYRDWIYEFEEYLRNQKLDESKIRSLFQTIDRKLDSIYNGVEIPYVTLSDERSLDQVTEIFEKINSTGITLNVFDLLIARLSKYKINLRKLWEESITNPKISKYYGNGKGVSKLPIYILESLSLAYTKSGSCKRKDILNIYENTNLTKEDFEEKWRIMTKYTSDAIELLENTKDGFGVITRNVLPFEPMIPILTSLIKEMDVAFKDKTKKCYDKIGNWYWTSVFSNAYSSAADSQKTSDHKDMLNWFKTDDEIPRGISKFRFNFQNLDLKSVEQRSNAMYKGVLCLIALKGGNDFDKNRSVADKKYDQDHIFPKSKFGDSENVNSILNITWLTKDTNSRIKNAKLPSIFVKQTIDEKYNKDEKDFLETLKTHFINEQAYEHIQNDEFEEFLDARLNTVLQEIGRKIGVSSEPVFITTMITAEQPYTAKRKLFRTALDSCQDYVHWIDKYFKKKGLEFLIDLRDNPSINEIKILLSQESADSTLRNEFKDFVEEMKNYGKSVQMRVITDSKIKQEFHDRWIISKNICYNVPSIDVAMRKQVSEFKVTENRPSFDKWWNRSLDIIEDWDDIQKIGNKSN